MSILQHIFPYIKYYFTSSTKYDVHSPFLFDFITQVLEDKKHYTAYDELENIFKKLKRNKTLLNVEDFGAGSVFGNRKQKTVSELFNNTAYKGKYGKLLFRIIQYYQPQNIVELGTGLGIATAYMALGNNNANITTIEGSSAIANIAKENFKLLSINNIKLINDKFDIAIPEVFTQKEKIDLVFIDGNHQYASTLKYFNTILPFCHNDTILIFDDISWSKEMQQVWNEIISNKKITLSLDLYKTGIVFFKSEIKVKQHFTVRY